MLRSFFAKALEKHSISKAPVLRSFSSVGSLKEELLSNPEFDQAFPHLREHKPSTQLPKDKQELDFIRSLFYRWRATGKVDSNEVIKANVRYNHALKLTRILDSDVQRGVSLSEWSLKGSHLGTERKNSHSS